jgi:hypothetical protein
MYRSVKSTVGLFLTGIGILGVSVAMTTLDSKKVTAQGMAKDVNVANTASNPVPTVAQGTTQVAGTVSVSNMPSITLASGGTVGIDPAKNQVQPVPVGEKRGQFFCMGVAQSGGDVGADCNLNVPAGQQFIIDEYSLQVRAPSPYVWTGGTISPSEVEIYVPVTKQGVDKSLNNVFFGSAPMAHIVVNAGETLRFVAVEFNGNANEANDYVSISVSGSGHYLPAPAP